MRHDPLRFRACSSASPPGDRRTSEHTVEQRSIACGLKPTRRILKSTLCVALLFALVGGSIVAAQEVRPAVPSLVVSTRGLADLTSSGLRMLEMAGEPQRAAQLQSMLAILDAVGGLDRDRPLGVLVYLSPERDRDPNLVAFLPIADMDALQRSLERFGRITLTPGIEAGSWELRAGDTTIQIRHSNGYAFLALKPELLVDPLPSVDTWTEHQAGFDLAATIHGRGIPSELIDRALTDLRAQAERDAQRRPDESTSDFELRSRLEGSLRWIAEHGIQEFERVTVGVTLPDDSEAVQFEAIVTAQAETELARVLTGIAGDSSRFDALSRGDAQLAASANWTISGGAQELVSQFIARLRADVEQRMQEDGTANGPAAEPIRQIMEALAATAEAGRVDGCLEFHGVRPGEMLLLASAEFAEAEGVAESLAGLLPLVAETPAVADLELNAIQVDGLVLHRVTLHEVRRQDEWLYGPDLGLYMGAGRNAIWLAVGGYEREPQLQALLERPAVAGGASPPVLRLDLRLAAWLLAETGPNGRVPPLLHAAREGFADGHDRLHVELMAGRGELRLRGTLEAGYIRLFGEVWRARKRRSSEVAPQNLAAPIVPRP